MLGLAVPEGKQALHLRIAHAISADIARGRLAPAERLPGSRSLAQQLGVHRNTALAAYRELERQGWIRSEAARGTYVTGRADRPRASLPVSAHATAAATRNQTPSYALPALNDARFGRMQPAAIMRGAHKSTLLLSGGRPDPRLFPVELLARAYRRALRRDGQHLLDYGSVFGHPALRKQLSEMLNTRRGLMTTTEDLLVTRGSQLALHLIAGVLIDPGDRVGVEEYAYQPACDAFRARGAELVALPIDEHGVDVEALCRAHARAPLRAVYLTPHHQYATGAALSAERRLRLLDHARAQGIAIVEDDYDHEYHYEGKPVLPLASSDPGVVYVGTLSKVLAPGLRIGYVTAPRALLERMVCMRAHVDRQGDLPTEAAVAELIEDGELQRHIWRTKRTYQGRRDALYAELRAQLSAHVEPTLSRGGIAMWVATSGLDVDRWAERAAAHGVYFVPGRAIRSDGRRSRHARLGFARHNEAELAEAVRRLALAASESKVA